MERQVIVQNNSSSEPEDPNEKNTKKKEDVAADPEFFSCLLQPSPPDSDPNYRGIRRLLPLRKAQSGVLRRKVLLPPLGRAFLDSLVNWRQNKIKCLYGMSTSTFVFFFLLLF